MIRSNRPIRNGSQADEARISPIDRTRERELLREVWSANPDGVSRAIAQGADVTVRLGSGESPLALAAKFVAALEADESCTLDLVERARAVFEILFRAGRHARQA